MTELDAPAAASVGAIKVISKEAVAELWARVNTLLGAYASEWSAENPEARLLAADRIAPHLPPTGWLPVPWISHPRSSDRKLSTEVLLADWPTPDGSGTITS